MTSPEPVHLFDRYFGARFCGEGRPTFYCAGGWEEAATQTFLRHVDEITNLDLLIQEGERIDIPPLGEAALCVKRMWITYRGEITSRGAITGLEQQARMKCNGIREIYFALFPGFRYAASGLRWLRVGCAEARSASVAQCLTRSMRLLRRHILHALVAPLRSPLS